MYIRGGIDVHALPRTKPDDFQNIASNVTFLNLLKQLSTNLFLLSHCKTWCPKKPLLWDGSVPSNQYTKQLVRC